ncbi:hypothetical protein RJT34_32226 [Clitoria ternatea]|uniref:SLC26A/SulP transporter domain-containing protein n=1 Tax=Clitoria ternatea TaxID=43366 RepID=A0AAN9EVN8_CLITE
MFACFPPLIASFCLFTPPSSRVPVAVPAHILLSSLLQQQLVFFVALLGWLIRFISHSVRSGFTTASAIVIGLSQAKYFMGYEIDRSSKILPLVESIIAGADKIIMDASVTNAQSLC